MYKVRRISDLTISLFSKHDRIEPVVTHYEVSSEPHRPFSYYVYGGVDITGKAMALDGNTMFDSEEDLKSVNSSDGVCDPRIGLLHLIEAAGVSAAKKAAEDAKTEEAK